MPIVTLRDACLAFGHVPLLDHTELQLEAGERIALIGRNGSGKSSLLSVLAGKAALDDGEFWRAPGLVVGYVAQEPELAPGQTVFEAIVSGMGEAAELLGAWHRVSARLAGGQGDHDALLAELAAMQARLEALGAWTLGHQAERAVERFGLDAEASVDTLSGGQRKRVALAQAMASEPDLLLLDEPTNHLDIESIEWLETLLVERRSALVLVTHDRRFLDRVATRIVELDRGRLTSHPGNFAAYQARKERMLADEAGHHEREDKLLAQEEVWIRKGIEARRTRNMGRVRRLEQLRAERAARLERSGRAAMRLDAGERSGQLVTEFEHVSKGFGEGAQRRWVVRDLSLRIMRGDKVGLIGPNGAGKTTLLRLILGELEPDSGTVRRGARLEVAYFDQFRAQLDPDAPLVEVVSPGSEFVEIGGERRHVMGYLGDFLFAPQRARSPVRSLSGGERNRLLLARLFTRPANLLVLDEPTNDLDIETLELLEALLQDYPGTVLLVSHDRAFLDNVVTQTIAFDGDARWVEHVGGYADWQAWKRASAQRSASESGAVDASRTGSRTAASGAGAASGTATAPATATLAATEAGTAPEAPRGRAAKLSYREVRELEAIPDRIAALEAEQQAATLRLEDPAFHAGAPEEARRVAHRLAEIEQELDTLLERWEQLEARQSEAQGSR